MAIKRRVETEPYIRGGVNVKSGSVSAAQAPNGEELSGIEIGLQRRSLYSAAGIKIWGTNDIGRHIWGSGAYGRVFKIKINYFDQRIRLRGESGQQQPRARHN